MKNTDIEIEENIEKIADKTKRDFMKKFGSYAASVPLAGFVLMTPETSEAQGWSCMPTPCKNVKNTGHKIRKNIQEKVHNVRDRIGRHQD